MVVGVGLCEIVEWVVDFMVGVEFVFGVLYFWYVIVDIGYVVFIVNVCVSGFIFWVLCFEYWGF